MNTAIYTIGQSIIILLTFGLFSSLMYGLRFVLHRLRVPETKRQEFRLYLNLCFFLWLAILAVLAHLGFFRDFSRIPPRIALAMLPPVALILVLLFSRRFGVFLRLIPESWLFYIQGFRVLMELFLWMGWRGGFVPRQMTFEGLNQDIIVGITGLMGGYVFFGARRYRRAEGIIWNVFGVVLLLNIVLVATLSTPSPLRVFMDEPANTFVAEVPFIWIPGFIVPFALAMHLFSLRQLIFIKPGPPRFRLRRRR